MNYSKQLIQILEQIDSLDDVKEENKNGTCYQDALHFFQNYFHSIPNLRLVHGLVTGQGAIAGLVYNHAWCEDNDTVYDPSIRKAFKKDFYYNLGKIKTTYKYDNKQTLDKMMEYETYGPWEKELLDNKF